MGDAGSLPRRGWLVLSPKRGLHIRVEGDPPTLLDYEGRDGKVLLFRRTVGHRRDTLTLFPAQPFVLAPGAWLSTSAAREGRACIFVPRELRDRITFTVGHRRASHAEA